MAGDCMRARFSEDLGQALACGVKRQADSLKNAPCVQAKVVQGLSRCQGSFGLLEKAPCSDFLPADCAKR